MVPTGHPPGQPSPSQAPDRAHDDAGDGPPSRCGHHPVLGLMVGTSQLVLPPRIPLVATPSITYFWTKMYKIRTGRTGAQAGNSGIAFLANWNEFVWAVFVLFSPERHQLVAVDLRRAAAVGAAAARDGGLRTNRDRHDALVPRALRSVAIRTRLLDHPGRAPLAIR